MYCQPAHSAQPRRMSLLAALLHPVACLVLRPVLYAGCPPTRSLPCCPPLTPTPRRLLWAPLLRMRCSSLARMCSSVGSQLAEDWLVCVWRPLAWQAGPTCICWCRLESNSPSAVLPGCAYHALLSPWLGPIRLLQSSTPPGAGTARSWSPPGRSLARSSRCRVGWGWGPTAVGQEAALGAGMVGGAGAGGMEAPALQEAWRAAAHQSCAALAQR